ncbi:MAG: tRNA uridine-5-carboxymethylaminomethyl(34) synthesis GTPase MnmE [Erythrobacter sp.]
MNDTIFALSSGAPPAAIGIIRVSGPAAGKAIEKLTGRSVEPRKAHVANLRDGNGNILDQALVLWFPGPKTATGEDLAEFHCHGGRAVIAAVEGALAALDGLRPAQVGEFTRRAFTNGRIDLSEAEGLAELLSAETELQRSAAIAMAGGVFSQQIENWRGQLLKLTALVEAVLDFSDDDDVSEMPESFSAQLAGLEQELQVWLNRPRSEKLGEGYRVVLAGPPNAGKSTLFNALLESEAAITAASAGTTRDVIERSVGLDGVPFTFVDTAGLREGSEDAIEVSGIARAHEQLRQADCVLWLGPEGEGPAGSWEIASQSDRSDVADKKNPMIAVSGKTGENVLQLKQLLVQAARGKLPKPGEAALNQRQHDLLSQAVNGLSDAGGQSDPLLVAEGLRTARQSFDRLTGRATTEDMLDTLFGRFCIGK